MNFFNKNFESIEFEDIQSLITAGIAENGTLEFKQQLWDIDKEEGTKEMLRDITSMANSYGGYIIVGVEEDANGNAREVKNIPQAEDEKERILNICLSCIEPRVGGFDIKTVGKEDTKVLLIKIPHSFRAPHLITYKGINQFFIRHGQHKGKMALEEIRDAFIKGSDFFKDTETFLTERRKKMSNKVVNGSPALLMGAFPLEQRGNFIDIKDPILREKLEKQENRRPSGGMNLHFFPYSKAHPSYNGIAIDDERDWRSVELFRNGYFEAHIACDEKEFIHPLKNNQNEIENRIISWELVEYIHSFFIQLHRIYEHLGYDGQYHAFIDILNIENVGLGRTTELNRHSMPFFMETKFWKEPNLQIGGFSFDHLDTDADTRFFWDRIWQAFGHEQSPYTITAGKIDGLT